MGLYDNFAPTANGRRKKGPATKRKRAETRDRSNAEKAKKRDRREQATLAQESNLLDKKLRDTRG